MRMQLCIGVTPRDVRVTLPQLVALGVAQSGGEPQKIKGRLAFVNVSPDAVWKAWSANNYDDNASIGWTFDDKADHWGHLSWDGSCAKVQNTDYPFTPLSLLGLLNRVDFTVANMYRAYPGWWSKPKMYRPPGLGDGHFSNGSFAAFSKADGHARVVSRRWLEYGPWRLLRDEETDLTLVQYHDLAASEAVALEQAYEGHQAMGIEDHGGFIQKRFPWGELKPTRYDRAAKTSIVLVQRQTQVTHEQMLEAAALKLWQPHPDHPIDQVAFVFTDEGNARRHLHDLWLRGLEVRVIDKRIDDSYDPGPPVPPDWVEAVQDREGS